MIDKMGDLPENIIGSRQIPNALILSAEDFARRENAVLSVMKALSKTVTISQIRTALKRYRNADQIVCDAIASLQKISVDCMDNCLDEKYDIAGKPVLIKSKKCENCPHAVPDGLQCKRQGLAFSQKYTMNQYNGITPEAQDMQSFFANSGLLVDLNPNNTNKKAIDITYEGVEMPIDLGKSEGTGSITNYQLVDCLPPDIEINPVKSSMPPLEVEELGIGGLDLTGIF